MGVAAKANLLKPGFLGTQAPFYADVVLVVEIAMGAALLIGASFSRLKMYRAHAWCQSVIVLLNFIAIVLVMIPSFRARVLPRIPGKLGKPYYLLVTAHAALGSIAEVLAIYIVLAAGTTLLPEKLQLVQYKRWMRSALVLWWLVLLLGLATYARWYIG